MGSGPPARYIRSATTRCGAPSTPWEIIRVCLHPMLVQAQRAIRQLDDDNGDDADDGESLLAS